MQGQCMQEAQAPAGSPSPLCCRGAERTKRGSGQHRSSEWGRVIYPVLRLCELGRQL